MTDSAQNVLVRHSFVPAILTTHRQIWVLVRRVWDLDNYTSTHTPGRTYVLRIAHWSSELYVSTRLSNF